MTLRATRAEAKTFDARFFERDERFAAIAPVAKIFADCTDWPAPADFDRELGARAGVRFVLAKPRPRRQRGPVDVRDMYDARIARGEVPTRERNWHDLLNAIVWATFPKSKATLHGVSTGRSAMGSARGRARSFRTRARASSMRSPSSTKAACSSSRRRRDSVLFGHALYEGLRARASAR